MNIPKTAILTTAYLPNIQYMSKLLSGLTIFIEVHDTYQKQSYRNRTIILGSNGPLDLVIPVKKPEGNRTKTCDILLDYDTPWQKIHWRAIVSAYKHSPFFDIFEEEFHPIFRHREKFLLDWNFYLLDKLATITGFTLDLHRTTTFENNYSEEVLDYRNTIHPKHRMKKPDSYFEIHPYFQVFNNKFGFIPNLSFIDLLFNEGPQALFLCNKTIKKG